MTEIMANGNNFKWGDISTELHKILWVQIADLSVAIQPLLYEIKIAYTYSAKKPNNDWQRWPTEKKISKIRINPVQPDRPLLIKPESSLNLAGFSETKVYVRLPVSIQISAVQNNRAEELLSIPVVKLSNTWFGSFKEGEICYSIHSGTRTEIESDPHRAYMAICPLKIKNKTKDPYTIDKICLRSAHLSFFMHQEQIWTDEVSIIYDGKNEISQVNFSGKHAADLDGAKMITRPKEIAKKSFYANSFTAIKDLAGSGLFTSK